jgi:hypothetical protein
MSEDPRDDYLWDRTGEGDAQLRGLEELLARYRVDREMPAAIDAADPEDDPAGG